MPTTRPPCKVSLFLTGRPDLNVVGGRGGVFFAITARKSGIGKHSGAPLALSHRWSIPVIPCQVLGDPVPFRARCGLTSFLAAVPLRRLRDRRYLW
jgi:hypothetical protein